MATDETYDPWETESGLGDIESFTFKGVKFGYDADYMNGEVCVMIVEDAVAVDDEGQTSEIRKLYPCGKGWEPKDGGKSVRHEKKSTPHFNGNSAMGLLVNAAIDLNPDLKARGLPTEAATWEGTTWKMTNKEFTNKINGEAVTYNRLLPVEYLGEKGAKKAAAKKATAKKTETVDEDAVTAEASDDDGKASTNGAVPPALKAKLRKAAKATIEAGNDYDAFLEDAFDVDGVSGNDTVEQALEGIWDAVAEEA